VGSFLVAPTWLDVPAADGSSLETGATAAETTPAAHHVLRLDPGTAFGTGQHPTTRLCLIAVEEALAAQPGARVLDVGTGSGILAIGAGLLGARELVGVDIDPRAAVTAAENAAVNGVELDARPGSIEAVHDAPFDLVVANILAHIIRELAPGLAALTRPGGRLIASGILDEQAEETAAALQAAGFAEPELRQDGDWVALIANRPAPTAPESGSPR
jgi:ribosomal protein L11 methyltransferase